MRINPFLSSSASSSDNKNEQNQTNPSDYFSDNYNEAVLKIKTAYHKLCTQRYCSFEEIDVCRDEFPYSNNNKTKKKDCEMLKMQIIIVNLDKKGVANDDADDAANNDKCLEDKLQMKLNEQTKLLVASSGVHGVEGFAGSAIQSLLLDRLQLSDKNATNDDDADDSPSSLFLPNTLLVLVHAVNPYGMKYYRRVNENNVDLNRNALSEEHFKSLTANDTLQATYDKFQHLFNPIKCSTFYKRIGFFPYALWNILQHGTITLKTALVAATYKNKKGVFFGGKELQSSHAVLRKYFQDQFRSKKVQCHNVIWIDIHTGLGPFAVDVIMSSAQDGIIVKPWFPKVAGICEGVQAASFSVGAERTVQKRCGKVLNENETSSKKQISSSSPSSLPSSGSTTNDSSSATAVATKSNRGLGFRILQLLGLESKSQSAGYEMTCGIICRNDWLNQFFFSSNKNNNLSGRHGSVIALTQEFGTQSNISVARALVMENHVYHYDNDNHQPWCVSTYMKPAFYCSDSIIWKQCILERGENMIGTVWEEFGRK